AACDRRRGRDRAWAGARPIFDTVSTGARRDGSPREHEPTRSPRPLARPMDSTLARSGRLRIRGGSLRGPGGGPSVRIGAEPVLVGRDPACALVLADPHVSAVHAEFVAGEKGVRVRDLGSRNGTFVGNAQLGEAHLVDEATVCVGTVDLFFEPT